MTSWLWKELFELNLREEKERYHSEFIEEYGYIGMLALAVAKWMPTNPRRGHGRPTPFDTMGYDEIVKRYRRAYWRTYGRDSCS